jgi:hypothetical protein
MALPVQVVLISACVIVSNDVTIVGVDNNMFVDVVVGLNCDVELELVNNFEDLRKAGSSVIARDAVTVIGDDDVDVPVAVDV